MVVAHTPQSVFIQNHRCYELRWLDDKYRTVQLPRDALGGTFDDQARQSGMREIAYNHEIGLDLFGHFDNLVPMIAFDQVAGRVEHR